MNHSCYNRPIAVTVLLSLLFAMPVVWGKLWYVQVPLFGEVVVIDFPVLALFALAVVAAGWSELRKLAEEDRACRALVIFAAFGGALTCFQQLRDGWNLTGFLASLFYFTVPLAGLLLAREIRRILPGFLLLLFLGSLLISLREWTAGLPAHGLVGNWNWNWTLLAASAPALAFFLPPRYRFPSATLLVAAIVAGQFLISPDYASRGTLLSCIGAAMILAAAPYLRCNRRIFAGLLIAGAVALAATYVGIRSGTLPAKIPLENRLTLWQGTMALGEAHALTGVGAARFEGEIASFLPLAYHDSAFAADRHPHPHNELLFYWCSFGILGVVWWFLTIGGGMRGVFRRRKRDELLLLAAWAWLVLLLHGQLDVILHTPLAGGLFLLLTGVLAAAGVRRIRPSAQLYRTRIAALLLFVGAAAVLAVMNLSAGLHCREGKLALLNGDPERARGTLIRSAKILPRAETLYTLGSVELFDFRNPEGAEVAFSRIASECRLPSYSHSAGRIARALAASGRLREAQPYFEQEQRNFPRGAVNLRLWESTLRALGDTEQANLRLGQWHALLTHKGITPQEFPHLLRNQHLDDSPLALKLFLENIRK